MSTSPQSSRTSIENAPLQQQGPLAAPLLRTCTIKFRKHTQLFNWEGFNVNEDKDVMVPQLSVKNVLLKDKLVNLPHVQYRRTRSSRITIPEEFKPLEKNCLLYYAKTGEIKKILLNNG